MASLLELIYLPLSVFIHALEKALEEVLEMLDRVSEYVARVIGSSYVSRP